MAAGGKTRLGDPLARPAAHQGFKVSLGGAGRMHRNLCGLILPPCSKSLLELAVAALADQGLVVRQGYGAFVALSVSEQTCTAQALQLAAAVQLPWRFFWQSLVIWMQQCTVHTL